ncbi:MAG TPA: hypothetical protein VFZ71_06760, partial [Pyrinomonadaceae bacterium]
FFRNSSYKLRGSELQPQGEIMKLKFLLALLLVTTSITAHSQQSSFTVAGLKPFEKAVPGQVMAVLIEGLSSGGTPVMIPETDFEVAVSQDGVTQPAKVRIAKFTMIRDMNPGKKSDPSKNSGSSSNAVEFAGMNMRAYHSVSFVVPQGLHPGPAEVVASYKGRPGNPVSMEIVEKPATPMVGGIAVLAVGGMPPQRTGELKVEGMDLGWRLERGTTVSVHVNPLVDPDDPNSAILIRFKQDGNEYDALTRVKSTPTRVTNRNGGVGFMAAREELQLEVPAALTLGKAQVEIRIKANGQVSDPVNVTATITDVTRVTEAPHVSAPRVLALTPRRVGAGQSVMISIDQIRALEPAPKDTQVIIEQENTRYFATIEHNSALLRPSKAPDAPVGMFVRTTRQLIGRVQLRVLNPLRGEQTGLSAPVPLEIVDEILPPELIGVREATDGDLAPMKEMYRLAQEVGKEFTSYDPSSRYLRIDARGIDYSPEFVRITLEQAGKKITLARSDFASYSGEGLLVRLPKGLSAGEVKFTIENSAGDEDRYSTPATKTFVLQSGT